MWGTFPSVEGSRVNGGLSAKGERYRESKRRGAGVAA